MGNAQGQGTNQTTLMAKFIVRGIVKDSSGIPVAGAAVLVGQEVAFTDYARRSKCMVRRLVASEK
jgi:hypothetical protein